MSEEASEKPTEYQVAFTDVAEAEAESAVVWMLGRMPERAGEWYAGLKAAARSLSTFPRRYAFVPNHERYEGEVRQMLYGKGRTSYHLVYRILDPAEDEIKGAIYILHIYHSARSREEPAEESKTVE